MSHVIRRASDRGITDIGWLKSWHSFSFGNYLDRSNMGFGKLRVMNDDVIAPASGFGSHGHDNMEIITIVLEGAVQHKDSMGVTSVIRAGDVQIMSAATGVIHSEYNISDGKPLKLLQIWIEPDNYYNQPLYEQRHIGNLSVHNVWVPLVSSFGHDALPIRQRAVLSLARLDKDSTLEYSVAQSGNGAYLFVIEGEVTVDGSALLVRDAIGVYQETPAVIAAKEPSLVLCIDVPMV